METQPSIIGVPLKEAVKKRAREVAQRTLGPNPSSVSNIPSKSSRPSSITKEIVDGITSEVFGIAKNITADAINEIIDMMIPNLLDMTDDEAKQALFMKANKLAFILKELAEDPEFQKLIKESGDAFNVLSSEIMDAVEEPILEMTDRSLGMMSEIAKNTSKTLSSSVVDVIMAALAEIPGLGGLLILGSVPLSGFNGVMKNIKLAEENLNKITNLGNKLTGNVLDITDDATNRYANLIARGENAVSNMNKNLEAFDKLQRQGIYDSRDSIPVQTNVVTPQKDNRISQEHAPQSVPQLQSRPKPQAQSVSKPQLQLSRPKPQAQSVSKPQSRPKPQLQLSRPKPQSQSVPKPQLQSRPKSQAQSVPKPQLQLSRPIPRPRPRAQMQQKNQPTRTLKNPNNSRKTVKKKRIQIK
jgi:hypothetical protein